MVYTNRRKFLKSLALGTFSAPLLSKKLLAFQNQTTREKKGEMFYRRLGRTDFKISEISLGGSPIPDWAILTQIVEHGVNYIDTSQSYSNGNSERAIGRLFKEMGRDKAYVGTKFHARRNWNEETILKSVEGSLKRLQTDHIDVLLIHGVDNEETLTDERVLSAFDKMRKQGKFRFTGISCHSNHHKVVKKAIECGHYDMVQLGYNVFDIEDTDEEQDIETYDDYLGISGIRQLISLARSKDVGIIAMKALKVAGKRQKLEKYKIDGNSIFQIMLKWALSNTNIASVVTEMLTFEQMEEDLAVVHHPLTAREQSSLYRYVAENSKDNCHMCGQCELHCPEGVKTTTILRYLAYYEGYEKHDRARRGYKSLMPGERATSCQNCGQCESLCPYGIAIRQKLQHAHTLLV
ncbi:MAG TPA: aldo/keto reductase [Candidatus Heimdallarchaeota archaeon]|nr:aldo/keto reductase [Candidatus Heimdallarchaeota archaeon]